MAEPLFQVRGLKVALPDMTRKPLFGAAPLVGASPSAPLPGEGESDMEFCVNLMVQGDVFYKWTRDRTPRVPLRHCR